MRAKSEAARDASGVLIRDLAAQDIPAISAILRESPQAARWSEESLLQSASDGSAAWVAELNGIVAGFLIGRRAADEFEILNMAVAVVHRGHGIGSKLLQSALDFTGITRVYLEVRASNRPAIALYARHGFTECGRRPRYYWDPVEDALLLARRLDANQSPHT
jgi:ribosomal-protein-alanine N-acetyltransferase